MRTDHIAIILAANLLLGCKAVGWSTDGNVYAPVETVFTAGPEMWPLIYLI